jgi:hypothetical protein
VTKQCWHEVDAYRCSADLGFERILQLIAGSAQPGMQCAANDRVTYAGYTRLVPEVDTLGHVYQRGGADLLYPVCLRG